MRLRRVFIERVSRLAALPGSSDVRTTPSELDSEDSTNRKRILEFIESSGIKHPGSLPPQMRNWVALEAGRRVFLSELDNQGLLV